MYKKHKNQTNKKPPTSHKKNIWLLYLGLKMYQTYLTAQGKLLSEHRSKDQSVFSLPYQ